MIERETRKIALVTGARRGIGAAIALRLAESDMFVIGTATSKEGVREIEENFKLNKQSGIGFVLNVNEK